MHRRLRKAAVTIVTGWLILFPLAAFAAGDPTGVETLRVNPGAPVDYVWILMCAFLVFFMQPGFAIFEECKVL